MPRSSPSPLSRREREIMDILHRLGRATAGEVMAELTGRPAYSTVRAQLRVLEDKGHIRHGEQNLRYVYSPARSRQVVQKSVLQHLRDTFFEGSAEKVVATLIGQERLKVSDDELDRIAEIIDKARQERRRK
jgi:predicted transcriptional regulator